MIGRLDGTPGNLGHILTHRARRHPDRIAIVEATRRRRFSYSELEARASRVAGGLARLGIEPGERVALLMQNGIEFVETYFALARLGAVLVPLNHRLVADELEFILRDAGAVALIADQEYDETVADLRERRLELRSWIRVGTGRGTGSTPYDRLLEAGESGPRGGGGHHDPLFVMYTSGTTGQPKGAVHTHASFLWASLLVNLTCDIRDGDRELVVLPLFHIGALLPLTWELHRGGTAVVLRSFDADLAVQVLEEERITTGLVVPTVFDVMLHHPKFEAIDHSSLRSMVVGGAPVPPALAQRARDAGITALQDYGSTEAAVVTIARPEDFLARPASAGPPLLHTAVRIVDDHGHDVANGEVGEIVVQGPQVMAGYWQRPDATADAIRSGWFHTGDLGSLDEQGCLYVQDRKKDMIISGGENIYPAEVERVLSGWSWLREVAVIGQPSARWGESPIAVVVPIPGRIVTTDDLVAYCRGRIAGYKIPRDVAVVDQMPRTPTGKVQKHLLRARFPGPARE